jgi:L-malate glycosyltransferase
MRKIMEPKRLNLLVLSSSSHIAGGEINLVSLIQTINQGKFRCHLAYHPLSKMEEFIQKAELIPLTWVQYEKRNIISVVHLLLRLFFIVFKKKIHIIYSNGVFALKYIMPVAKLLNVPVLVDIQSHETDISLRWSGIKLARKILFCSKALMNEIRSHSAWLDPNVCFALHNAVDLNEFFPRDTSRLKKELGLNSDLPIVGIVGQLKKIKGQEIFIKMVRKLTSNGIKAQYIIVGDDNVQRGDYTKVLRLSAKNLGLDDHVMFLGYRKDIPDIMSLLDLATVPSLHEPFGRVVVEAMACGTPVVASRVGGIIEIFEDGDGGLFCNPNDVDSLCEKVSYFFENKDWWKSQKKRAVSIVKERFGHQIRTSGIEEHLLAIVKKR